MKSMKVGLILGTAFGFAVASVFHCHVDLTAVAVATVATVPVLIGQWLSYNLAKNNRGLIWNMHEANTQKLDTIKEEISNGSNDKSNQA